MTARHPRAFAAAALACVSVLALRGARAEGLGDVALNQLEPAPSGDPFFSAASPFIGGHVVPRASVMVDHAGQPLVLSSDSASGDVVSRQTWLHLNASIALWDRLLLDALFPIVLAQAGESPLSQGVALPSPSSAALGDLRIGARIRLFGADDDTFQLAAGAYVHAPLGTPGAFAGEGALRASPLLLIGGRASRFVWSAAAGAVLRASENPSTLTYSAAAAVLFWEGLLQVGPEIFGAIPLQNGLLQVGGGAEPLARGDATNLEVLLGARARLPAGFSVGMAVAAGLTDAIGTPAYRLLGALSWAPVSERSKGKSPDADAARLVDDADADGFPDDTDACPHAFGPRSLDPTRNGCRIEDRDEDGVADPDDACPDTPGDRSADAKKNGCPEDSDG